MILRYLTILFVCSTSLLFGGKMKNFLKDMDSAKQYAPIHVENKMVISIAMEDDEYFYVPLAENPTTGFQWEVEVDNPQCIEVKAADFITSQPPAPPHRKGPDGKPPRPGEHQPMLVGAGGKKIFTFKTLKKGTVNLTFRHRRNWEDHTPPEKEFTMIVFITE